MAPTGGTKNQALAKRAQHALFGEDQRGRKKTGWKTPAVPFSLQQENYTIPEKKSIGTINWLLL
jgi:hypothetical protein